MSNPLFQQYGKTMNILQQFMQFKQGFNGDPKAEVQKILQSGRLNQQQINQVNRMANQLQGIMRMFGK